MAVLDTIPDDGLISSGGSNSDEGEELYAYLGEPVLHRGELEAELALESAVDYWDGAGDDLSKDRVDVESREELSTEEDAEEQFDDALSKAISRAGSPFTDRDESEDDMVSNFN